MQLNEVLVKHMIAAQFPQWADLTVEPVPVNGWDNRTFRLGKTMLVRLPSHQRYAAQVSKEHRWLPVLASQLPLPIPTPIVMGQPSEEYPFHWSIYNWIEGEIASHKRIQNIPEFAEQLAGFLRCLYQIDTKGGPAAGRHNFYRGGPLMVYHQETLRTIQALGNDIDGPLAKQVWQDGLTSQWTQTPVWVHGDVASSNLLIKDGSLHAVIDFGCLGVGDPACDLTIAWTFLNEEGRFRFRRAIGVDDETWARARGWAIWKALLIYHSNQTAEPEKAQKAFDVIQVVMKEYLEQQP